VGIAILLVIVFLIGLGEMHRSLGRPWRQLLAPWGLASLLQLVLGVPAAFALNLLLVAALNLLFT
jgi:hypothetical protein